MPTCRRCEKELPEESRFCTRCGTSLYASAQPKPAKAVTDGHEAEDMNMTALYVMVAALIIAILFPPWEAPPGQSPEFLGFHFILSPPEVGLNERQTVGIISRLLITIELVTIAVAGFYFSWLFRRKDRQ